MTNPPRLMQIVSFAIIGGLASALTVNVPSLLIGYGLVFVVMLLASWLYKPLEAALVVLGAMLVALPIQIFAVTVFYQIALLGLVMRPLLAYAASWMNLRKGKMASALVLTVLETIIGLSVAVATFGLDGAELAFSIFAILLIPFAYLILLSVRQVGGARIVALAASLASLLAFYFSVSAFLAVWTLLLALSATAILSSRVRSGSISRNASVAALILAVGGLFLGGTPLAYNLNVSLYPFNPHSWMSTRWEQLDTAMCPTKDNVFNATHNPPRLRIVSTCVTVTGTVERPVTAEVDGDYTFDLTPDQQYTYMLSLGSLILKGGRLHIEVVPADQYAVLNPVGGGVCPGDTVRITGVFVVDTDHGVFSEVHPALNITIITHDSGMTWPKCILGQSTGLP